MAITTMTDTLMLEKKSLESLFAKETPITAVFMGTPEFAVPSLDALLRNGYEVKAVVTQTDKPKGRGGKPAFPPVKVFASNHCLHILQPDKLNDEDFYNVMREIEPDFFVTCAFGKLIPEKILQIPKYGCINVHSSLLPQLRGPAPMRWSLIKGDEITGITTMMTDKGMDTGDILLQEKIEIPEDMTYGQLHDIMAIKGAELLLKTLKGVKTDTIHPKKQNDSEATYAPAINKELSHIDWNKASSEIYNLFRGLSPEPGVFSFLGDIRIKIWEMKIGCDKNGARPGTIISADKNGIVVSTNGGSIIITGIQAGSGKRMTVESYLCGHRIEKGDILS